MIANVIAMMAVKIQENAHVTKKIKI